MNNKDIPQMKPMLNTTKTINPATTIVFIDAGVENADLLIEGVIPTTEVFVLDGTADGIEQISQVLQQRQNTDAVHIISHGSPGCLYLGNSQLSLNNLIHYAPQLQKWDVANVLLYGCNVAAGDAGEEFITNLHALTGWEIAASKSLTGSAAKGGNWELEVTTAHKQPVLAIQAEARANYGYVLTNAFGYTDTETAYQAIDLVPGATGVTSILTGVDDASVGVNLGSNTFNFYGTNYSSLFVSSNGLITFGSANASFSNTDLSSSPTQAAISTLWDDWVTYGANGQVLYQFQDLNSDGVSDRLVIEWNEVYIIGDSVNPVTFQTILNLNTASQAGNITFNYPDLLSGSASASNGGSATVGIKNANGDPLLVSFDDANNPLLGSGKAIKISVIPPITGTPNNDILRGTADADQINGLAGSDVLYGNAGNDTIDGGDGDDIAYGGNDNDLLRGGNGSDRLYGDAGNDELLGEVGNDILYGGDGDDLLNGGAGNDQLYGNAGIDTFVLAAGMGLDSIYNFQDGVDRIRLDGGLTFGALQIAQSGTYTLIKIASTGVTLASLVNTNSALVGVDDFSAIAPVELS
ncbi:MAG: DUF4347 domain-containing protein [Microcoleus sp.]